MEAVKTNPEAIRVGAKIVAARKRRGISQVELSRRLAERLGREPESVRRTLINNERGRNVPRMGFLEAIADELGESLDSFRLGAEDGATGKAA